MQFLLRWLVVAAMFAGTAVVPAAEPADSLPSPPTPGRFTLVIKSGDFERTAHIQIPPGYKSGASPLVLLLHGAGGSGAGILDKDGWSAKADKEGFVAVAPDGAPALPKLSPDFRTNPAIWNAGQLRPRSPRAAIDDVAFIRKLLDELKETVPYDEHRAYCAGHSNGGGMTFRLASELSERFAAIGMVAGSMDVADPKPKKALPTLYILGTKDPFMPIEGGDVKLPWGHRHNRPMADVFAAWAKALDCEKEPKTISDKGSLKTVVYPSKSGGPTLSVIYIEGQGHDWPGGHSPLPESMVGPKTNKLDATNALWDFFKSHGSSAN